MFIVEMSSTGLNNAGEPGLVVNGEKVWNTFDVHVRTWTALQALGKKYGWVPAGTVAYKDSSLAEFKPDYEVEEWAYAKRVTVEDAMSWATALELARGDWPVSGFTEQPTPALIVEGMTEVQHEHINSGINSELLRDFIAFLRCGSFLFAWDD